MATAVKQEKKVANASSDNRAAVPSGGSGFLHPHKAGEGYATRLGCFVIGMLFVWFAAHHWYYSWTVVIGHLNLWGMLDFAMRDPVRDWVEIGGTFVLVAGGMLLFYNIVYCRPRTSEFLVKTDGELAKVTWPSVTPWFKPEAKVWGASYVVLAVLGILTVYIFAIDAILNLAAQWAFYGK